MTAVIAAPSGVQALTAILCYLTEVSDPKPQSIKELLESRVGAQAVEAYMTAADRLRQQGRAEGRAEGRVEILRKLITLKFGTLTPDAENLLCSATIADLDRWSERVLSAQRPEDIFV
jgi:hypothetical protein